MLTVLSRAENRNGRTYWVCQCDCGSEPKEIMGKHLSSGATVSCGCYRPDRAIDLTGKKFNRWTVKRRVANSQDGKATWLCECECGNTAIHAGGTITSGHSKSCGCYKIDAAHDRRNVLTGRRFGRLLVGPESRSSKTGKFRWECKCDCGKTKAVFGNDLVSGQTQSCGCLQRELVSGENNVRWVGGAEYSGYDSALKSIGFAEEVRRDPNNSKAVQVKCTLCDKWFTPTTTQISMRRNGLHGNTTPEGWYSEGRFYCSDECKSQCSIYNQKKYPKGFRPTNERQEIIDPEIRILTLNRDSYQCQKCGACNDLEVHHIEGVMQEPMLANDLDNCLTVCADCHAEIHSQPGCSFNDYQRASCEEIAKEAVNQ